MELVVGGAWQGKFQYVLEREAAGGRLYNLNKDIAFGESCSYEELLERPVCRDFHLFCKRVIAGEVRGLTWESEEGRVQTAEALSSRRPDRIIITDEIGCGIVPMDAFERKYRELTGRVCCLLAKKANHVTRVLCGRGQQLS